MRRSLLSITLFSVIVCSCTGILDKGPADELTENTYWTSVDDLRLYLNHFYPSFGSHLNFDTIDNNSDNMQPMAVSKILNGSRAVPSTGGEWTWGNISDINYYFANAPKISSPNQSSMDQYMGEGYFFKAYFYFQKVKRFGAVPWYNKVLNIDSEGLQAPRDPRDAVVDSILKDLDKAIVRLQLKSELPSNLVNKGVALLFKSRVALYEGTWEKYHTDDPFRVDGSQGKKYLEQAAQAAEQLIDMGNYGIYSTGNPKQDYWKFFNRTDLSDNMEVLLWRDSDNSKGLGHRAWKGVNGTVGTRTGITKQMVDAYLDENGKPISISKVYHGDTTLTQVVKNRDPRLKQSMWVPGQVQINYAEAPLIFKYPTLNEGGYALSSTGYMVRKGSTPDPSQNQGASGSGFGKVDGIVFRYAEALLNYAEAKAELEEITQADLDKSINLLRERVGMPKLDYPVKFTDPNWNFPDLSPIINEIRRERRVELAFEGFRYDDLMRWAAADLIKGLKLKGARFIKGKSFPQIEDQITDIQVDKNHYISRYKNELPSGFKFDKSRDYLYPIPSRELTLNKNLTQNPGW